jgi:hypothetical protein
MKLLIFTAVVAIAMLTAPEFAAMLRRLPSSNDDFAF